MLSIDERYQRLEKAGYVRADGYWVKRAPAMVSHGRGWTYTVVVTHGGYDLVSLRNNKGQVQRQWRLDYDDIP